MHNPGTRVFAAQDRQDADQSHLAPIKKLYNLLFYI